MNAKDEAKWHIDQLCLAAFGDIKLDTLSIAKARQTALLAIYENDKRIDSAVYAAKFALAVAESHVISEYEGTSKLDDMLAALQPARDAIAAATGRTTRGEPA